MEEDRLVDAPRKTLAGRALVFWLAVLMLAGPAACAKRLIVFKDVLTPQEHLNLGVVYEREGNLDAAEMHYKAASRELPAAQAYLGNIYFLMNDTRKAEKYYRKALRRDPENADALNNLAWLYYTEGRNLDEAEELVTEALRLNPSKAEQYNDTLLKIRSLKLHRSR